MKDIVIVGGTRTAIGTFGGTLRDVTANQFSPFIVDSVIRNTGIEKNMIDKVILGCCFEGVEHNVARVGLLKAGLPFETTAHQVVATCGSGMQAIMNGIQSISDDDSSCVIAGGVESMSTAPFVLKTARWGMRFKHNECTDAVWKSMQEPPVGPGMGLTAENLAEKYGISREEQDVLALRSQQLAGRAIREGRFRDEISPFPVPQRRGEPKMFDTDEHPKLDTTMEKLAVLPPAFKEGGTVTAGNSSGINDAAAALIIMTRKKAKELGLKPRARFASYAVAGVDPAYMGIGPVPATRKALKRAGWKLDDIELIEINEAFAAQCIACERELGWNRDIVNVNGSGIALGHPVGCTGARIVVTLLYEMEKRNLHRGLATLCAGGGQGFAIIIERD
ncbi:MAG: acetyl-CoA C-acetyltransferase [Syntrophales bacterium]|jgi:acetyl-CoA C-acetyltransferase|nr:acetyl-CoA C-acetyltransferase [Syntrophales bacterium]